MDGIESATGVVVIGATNRIDCLDSAFLRPGRIDKRILVTTPNVKGMGGVVFLLNVTLCNQLARHEILKVHVSRMPCSNDVSLIEIANNTKGISDNLTDFVVYVHNMFSRCQRCGFREHL